MEGLPTIHQGTTKSRCLEWNRDVSAVIGSGIEGVWVEIATNTRPLYFNSGSHHRAFL
jgi:hypothetical protein